MTEQIKSTIDFLTRYKGCQYEIDPNECCHRQCSECEYNFDIRTAQKDIETAIRSLQAWDEVLYELQHTRSAPSATFKQGIRVAEDIINQHLAEIEEGEEYE